MEKWCINGIDMLYIRSHRPPRCARSFLPFLQRASGRGPNKGRRGIGGSGLFKEAVFPCFRVVLLHEPHKLKRHSCKQVTGHRWGLRRLADQRAVSCLLEYGHGPNEQQGGSAGSNSCWRHLTWFFSTLCFVPPLQKSSR